MSVRSRNISNYSLQPTFRKADVRLAEFVLQCCLGGAEEDRRERRGFKPLQRVSSTLDASKSYTSGQVFRLRIRCNGEEPPEVMMIVVCCEQRNQRENNGAFF